ncbi:uncharacterized protein LOC132494205 [Mesoplodon densirostris]|uniref:uncharacterized protein LOC132494205 n=1 Tax=Mesoplodon densirostris TaxID=48708 RepID=UPI0028DBCE4D|nr:uncharacterized protein LOC132494205 [Mesoplodon densirostris]
MEVSRPKSSSGTTKYKSNSAHLTPLGPLGVEEDWTEREKGPMKVQYLLWDLTPERPPSSFRSAQESFMSCWFAVSGSQLQGLLCQIENYFNHPASILDCSNADRKPDPIFRLLDKSKDKTGLDLVTGNSKSKLNVRSSLTENPSVKEPLYLGMAQHWENKPWVAIVERSFQEPVPGEAPLPPRLARNVAIRPGAGDDFRRPELGAGSRCCSWQVGWGPAELTTHRRGAAALRPPGSRRRGHALIRSLRRSVWASHCCGLSRCGAQAPDVQAQRPWLTGPARSVACGILPDRGTNPRPLHRQADSQPLRHQGSPDLHFFKDLKWELFLSTGTKAAEMTRKQVPRRIVNQRTLIHGKGIPEGALNVTHSKGFIQGFPIKIIFTKKKQFSDFE